MFTFKNKSLMEKKVISNFFFEVSPHLKDLLTSGTYLGHIMQTSLYQHLLTGTHVSS